MPAPKLSGLAHLVIRVRDLNRSVSFYKEVLGLEVREQFPAMAFLNTPGSTASQELGLMAIGASTTPPTSSAAWEASSTERLGSLSAATPAKGDAISMATP